MFYRRYGGVKVCERWYKYKNFLADMGERPEGHQIHRIDNTRGYEPGNCEWLTPQQHREKHKKSR
jgi:hypothetical protein